MGLHSNNFLGKAKKGFLFYLFTRRDMFDFFSSIRRY